MERKEDHNCYEMGYCECRDCVECPYYIECIDLCEFELPTGDDLTNCH